VPKSAQICQNVPESAKICQNLPKSARICQNLPLHIAAKYANSASLK
jgi:hypothetical protein